MLGIPRPATRSRKPRGYLASRFGVVTGRCIVARASRTRAGRTAMAAGWRLASRAGTMDERPSRVLRRQDRISQSVRAKLPSGRIPWIYTGNNKRHEEQFNSNGGERTSPTMDRDERLTRIRPKMERNFVQVEYGPRLIGLDPGRTLCMGCDEPITQPICVGYWALAGA